MDKQDQPGSITWERSPNFRKVHSDYFLFRFAPGEGVILFSQMDSRPGSLQQTHGIEEVAVSMPLPNLKLLAEYITVSIEELEREIGPIVSVGIPPEELRQQAAEIVRSFAIRKK